MKNKIYHTETPPTPFTPRQSEKKKSTSLPVRHRKVNGTCCSFLHKLLGNVETSYFRTATLAQQLEDPDAQVPSSAVTTSNTDEQICAHTHTHTHTCTHTIYNSNVSLIFILGSGIKHSAIYITLSECGTVAILHYELR